MKKMLLAMGFIMGSMFSLFSQGCENYSFYLVDNHINQNGRSSEIYNVVLDDATQTAELTELYALDKTVHIAFDEETQSLYAVCSQTGGVFVFDVANLAPPQLIGMMSSGFGFVQMVYDGAGGLITSNEVTDEVFRYDIATSTETFLMTADVDGGDLVITQSGETLMFTRNNGGEIVDLTNGQTVIGTTPDWTTGAALMNNGQILVSVRFENEFVVRNADGSAAGSYAILKDGLPFELDNGDLTGGCNDPIEEEECGDCEGQITELSLEYIGDETDVTIEIYEGKVQPNKLFETFTGVNPGDVLSFSGTKNHGKMGAKIFLTINGSGPIEIHTSCSQPIGVGSIFGGTYLVTAGESHGGGPLCEITDTPDDTPEEDCGDCEGQITELSLEFIGDETDATVEIYESKFQPNKLFQTFTGVNPGDVMSFVGIRNQGKMGPKIFLVLNDGEPIEIHTSCSQPIGIGFEYGDLYRIVDGASHGGGQLCSGDNAAPSISGLIETTTDNDLPQTIGTLNYFPNPSAGSIVVDYESTSTDQTVIEIYNTQGQMVKSVYSGIIEEGVQFRKQVDLSNLDNGVYLIRIVNSQDSDVRKLMIAR
jgi:hypothetical protein